MNQGEIQINGPKHNVIHYYLKGLTPKRWYMLTLCVEKEEGFINIKDYVDVIIKRLEEYMKIAKKD